MLKISSSLSFSFLVFIFFLYLFSFKICLVYRLLVIENDETVDYLEEKMSTIEPTTTLEMISDEHFEQSNANNQQQTTKTTDYFSSSSSHSSTSFIDRSTVSNQHYSSNGAINDEKVIFIEPLNRNESFENLSSSCSEPWIHMRLTNACLFGLKKSSNLNWFQARNSCQSLDSSTQKSDLFTLNNFKDFSLLARK